MFISLNYKNKNITYLEKQCERKITKRFSGIMTVVTKKVITPQIAQEQVNILRNKLIFLKYCEHFKKINYEDLTQDSLFIKEMDDMINSNISLHSRAFQLALEVTYRKRHFNINSLQAFYANDFSIENVFNINQNTCEQSTIYSALSTKKLVTTLRLDKKDVIVNCTPYEISPSNITKDIQNIMDFSKKMTGNSCCDLMIHKRPFDFKDTKTFSIAQNHIYNVSAEFMLLKGHKILFDLEKHLAFTIEKNYTRLDLNTLNFIKQVQKKLQYYRESNTPIESRFEMLNKISISTNVPKEFKMPIFIVSKKPLIETLYSEDHIAAKDVPLEHGNLDYPKAQKAIMGICSTYNNQLKNKITEITNNSLTFNTDDID